ncbi:MAG: calcium/sodium antiporter [Paludibacteraceae bacterium]|nr:calcium/sodium antiporter [Paludibacteraceae bacterium]
MDYLFLIAGLVLLFLGGDYLVDGAVDIANRFKVSPLIVGMTIVAFGTSAPEFIVSLESAIGGHPEISLGNVIGSNIANIGLILGFTALILPLAVQKATFTRDMPFLLIISILLFAVLKDGVVSRFEGIMFVALIICHTLWCIKQTPRPEKETVAEPKYKLWVAIAITLGAVIALTIGSDLLIMGASALAKSWGISERVIAVTIVAFGTSIPELVTSIIAAAKKQADIAIGNIVGSNIFNILFVLGTSATICPISNYNFDVFKFDLWWMIGFVLFLLIAIFPFKRVVLKKSYPDTRYSTLGRIPGAVMFLAYTLYVTLLF